MTELPSHIGPYHVTASSQGVFIAGVAVKWLQELGDALP